MDHARFEDPEFVKLYTEGPGRFVPGYQVMQRVAAQLIAERVGEIGKVLVLGAGGGLEIETFAREYPKWTYLGVDPAGEMLEAARARAAACGVSAAWVRGYIFDAPDEKHDAATTMLTLHFVPDDGGKLATLRAVHDRLKPNAPFILVDLCIDKRAPDYERAVDRYRTFALRSNAQPDDVAGTIERVRNLLQTVAPERNEALLREAGFKDPQLFYAGLSWRGWVAYA
ncbi:hypothetical protein U91I_01970 [alpha proteobacterium U9-1i]|nr:hypothetical protein U91I_01970 [alpha proteobacterium U9-1i]